MQGFGRGIRRKRKRICFPKETNVSSRAESQQCRVAPPASKAAGWGSSHPARLPEAELKVPTGQRSSGLILPCPGSTCVEVRLSVKLQAAEKQTLLVALSRHRAEDAGVLQMLGVLQMSVTWQAPGGAASLQGARIHLFPLLLLSAVRWTSFALEGKSCGF